MLSHRFDIGDNVVVKGDDVMHTIKDVFYMNFYDINILEDNSAHYTENLELKNALRQ